MDENGKKQGEETHFEPTNEPEHADLEIEEEEARGLDKVKKLRDNLRDCEKEKMAALEDLQRVKADFLNSKRRLEDQLASDKEKLAVAHVLELLPLADSFEMSLRADNAGEASTWRKGFEQIHAQLTSILARYGVERIGTVGDVFDPSVHEAVSNEVVTDETKHHTVTAVLQSGYTMNDKVIRAARVSVGEYSE